MKRHFISVSILLTAAMLVAAAPASATPSAALAAVSSVEFVNWVTGPNSPNRTDENWDVHGTDLGVMFEYNDSVLVAFGDTFGCCGNGNGVFGENWRSNALAWSSDNDLSTGMRLDGMVTDASGDAVHILNREPGDYTIIPTAGIEVDGQIYLHYMAVRQWGQPGEWTLNRSGWAYADSPDGVWEQPASATWQGDSAFGQAALVKRDDFLYVFGIPGGRFGGVSLARVPEDQILDMSAYRYWDGAGWNPDMSRAAEVASSPVGELSVAWNDHLQSWIMTYLNEQMAAIVIRTAPDLVGPWSDPMPVVSGTDYPALYGAYLHPWASSGDTIYFTMSQWGQYNVELMRVRLLRP